MHQVVEGTANTNIANASANEVTWHVDDVPWTPLTGLFIQKAGYKTVIPPEFTSNAYSIELTTVGPGGSSPTHVEPWAHVFYVLSGYGEVTVGDEVKPVRAGSVSPISAGQPHSFRTLGDTPLEMLVIYHPPRKRVPPADKLRVRVHALREEAEGVVSVELRSPDGADLPPFEPGAHIDLHLPNGLVRSYSLCGTTPGHYRIGVLKDRASRGGSAYVHEQMRVGTSIEISRPRNHFPLQEAAAHSVLIAGGIGITPILSMLRRLRQLGRSAELIYAARSRAEAAFVAEVEAIGVPVTWHFDDEQGGAPDLRQMLQARPADAHFYACGPAPMLDAFESHCAALAYSHVHVERFSAPGQPAADARQSFQVTLARSGRTIDIRPERSILDTLLDAGIEVPYGCKAGNCGACRTRVLRGDPDHRDTVLTPAERAAGNVMTLCVSGCRSEALVLDL